MNQLTLTYQNTGMKTVKTLTLLIAFTVIGVLATRCSTLSDKKVEGTILYDVSFPYLEDPVLANVFPEEMKLSFQGGNTHGYLKSLGGIVTSEFISNEKDRTFTQLLKAFSDRYVMQLDETEVQDYLKGQTLLELVPTKETKEICGYTCQKTIANFRTDSMPPVYLFHTNELDLPNPNWFNQYAAIEGVLLGYEVEQYGMRMKLEAKEVTLKEVDNTLFTVDSKYQTIDANKMESVIDSLMGNLGGTTHTAN